VTGLFISIDGPGGIGKSTLVNAAVERLRATGHHVHPTTEPSRSPLGTFTRAHADSITDRALACTSPG
jgi:dTMP kinase